MLNYKWNEYYQLVAKQKKGIIFTEQEAFKYINELKEKYKQFEVSEKEWMILKRKILNNHIFNFNVQIYFKLKSNRIKIDNHIADNEYKIKGINWEERRDEVIKRLVFLSETTDIFIEDIRNEGYTEKIIWAFLFEE